jgi:hypothetical protein
MLALWFSRLALAAFAVVLTGCAATPPKEPIRLSGVPKPSLEILRIQDGRKADAAASETVQLVAGEGARIPTHLIDPDALQVFNALLNEYLEAQTVKPLTETFAVSRLDVLIMKGKALPVTPPPGVEGYAGYLGAAIGKMMAQAYENSKVPDFVRASLTMKSSSRELSCDGSYSIYSGQIAEATMAALKNAAIDCGRDFLPGR